MFTPGSVSLLREVYSWTLTDMDVNDIDDQKYMLCKRLSEVRLSFTLRICNTLLMMTVGQQPRAIHRAKAPIDTRWQRPNRHIRFPVRHHAQPESRRVHTCSSLLDQAITIEHRARL